MRKLTRLKAWRWAGVLAAIYLIALFPLLRANVNYIDDAGRTFTGGAGWDNFSRYLSTFLSSLIHASDDFLADISPLTQLIAIAAMVLASMIVLNQVRGGRAFSMWDLAAILPLGLSPYFLECFSYKYDAPYMAFSVLLSVLPLVVRRRGIVVYGSATALCMIGVCTTYQAASGIFPMAVLLLALRDWLRGEDARRALGFVAVSACSYLIGIAVFAGFLMTPPGEGYVATGIASLSGALGHYRTYWSLLVSDLKGVWIAVSGLLIIWFVVSAALQDMRPKLQAVLVAAATALAMFLLAFGLYPALAAPIFEPRTMYGIGAFIGIGCTAEGPGRWVTRLLAIALAWFLVTFAASYGNALSVQQEWEDFRRAEVVEDLADLPAFNTDEPKLIQLEGSAGLAQSVTNASAGYDMMKRLVPVTFCGDWVWGYEALMNEYGLRNVSYDLSDQVEAWDDFPLLQESAYHAIYGKDNRFIVVLK